MKRPGKRPTWRRKRSRGLFGPTISATGWGESTFAEVAWDKSRGAVARWSVAGAVLGALVAVPIFAPAAWLASAVASATNQRVLLADARGTIWSGSAVAVLTGGEGSRDASSLPGRINWNIGLRGLALEVRARHDCCLNGTVLLQVRPGFGRVTATLVPPAGNASAGNTPGWIGQWPSALLGGLGTPWNTLQLGGAVRLVSPGISVESVQGRWRVEGSAHVELVNVASRLTTLDTLGSYRMSLTSDPANAGVSQLQLSTQEGALQLTGNGTWGPGGVRFRGDASAASAEDEPALTNLLNIIGRRSGARSVISIG